MKVNGNCEKRCAELAEVFILSNILNKFQDISRREQLDAPPRACRRDVCVIGVKI